MCKSFVLLRAVLQPGSRAGRRGDRGHFAGDRGHPTRQLPFQRAFAAQSSACFLQKELPLRILMDYLIPERPIGVRQACHAKKTRKPTLEPGFRLLLVINCREPLRKAVVTLASAIRMKVNHPLD